MGLALANLDTASPRQSSYDAYGNARHHRLGDLTGDGAMTSADMDLINGTGGSFGGYGIDDLNRDGIVDSTDTSLVNGDLGSALPAGQISATDNIIGYTGYVFNAEIHGGGLYTVRHRHYSPELGRWTTRDPLGYVDGMSLYEYAKSQVLRYSDPTGTRFEVQLVCRHVRDPRAATYNHCAVVACCHDSETGESNCFRYEVTGRNPDGSGKKAKSPSSGLIAPDEIAYEVESYDDDCARKRRGSDEAPCALAECIARAFDAIDHPKYRPILGPNSNTFARKMLERCDLRFKPHSIRFRKTSIPGIQDSEPRYVEHEVILSAPERAHGWGLYNRNCECPPTRGRGATDVPGRGYSGNPVY